MFVPTLFELSCLECVIIYVLGFLVVFFGVVAQMFVVAVGVQPMGRQPYSDCTVSENSPFKTLVA